MLCLYSRQGREREGAALFMTGCVAGGCFGIRGRQLTSGIIHGGVSKLFLRLGFSPLFHSLSFGVPCFILPFIDLF